MLLRIIAHFVVKIKIFFDYFFTNEIKINRIFRIRLIFILSSDLKSVFASRTYHGVLTLCTGQTEHGTALGALAVNMCFSVSEFVSPQLKKAAEFFIFFAPFLNIP